MVQRGVAAVDLKSCESTVKDVLSHGRICSVVKLWNMHGYAWICVRAGLAFLCSTHIARVTMQA